MAVDNNCIVRTKTMPAVLGRDGGFGVLPQVKNKRLLKIEIDPEHLGLLCTRALSMTRFIYYCDRRKFSLRRTGENEEDKFEEILWEAVFNLFESRVKAIKDNLRPESMFFSMGTNLISVSGF